MRRAAAAAAVLALPLVAAACGGSGKKTSTETTTSAAPAGTVIGDAVAKTLKAGSEHVVLRADVAAGGQHVGLSGSGDFDTAKRTGTMHATFSLGGIQTGADEVLNGSTVYVSSPFFSAMLPAGKKWLTLDLAKAGSTLGPDASALTAQDPASALAQLKALTGVTEVGSPDVNGTPTTHYRGRIDVSKLPASSAALVQSTGASFGPADVWVGDDGYVHRVRIVTNASQGGQKTKTTVTMTLSGYGAAVSVTVPPASETVDASSVTIPGLTG